MQGRREASHRYPEQASPERHVVVAPQLMRSFDMVIISSERAGSSSSARSIDQGVARGEIATLKERLQPCLMSDANQPYTLRMLV